MKNLTNEIRAYALKNSIEYEKAVVGKVLPKLFNHGLKKEEIQKIMPELRIMQIKSPCFLSYFIKVQGVYKDLLDKSLSHSTLLTNLLRD